VLVLHLAAIALVLGAPVFFGTVVAPQSFKLLPTHDMAGALQATILTRLCWILEAGFALLLLTSWWLTREGSGRLLRMLMTRAAFLGLIAGVVIEKLLVARIERIRQEAPGLIDNLPAADPSRILLGRLHRLSTGFFAVEIAAGALILVTTARLLAGRSRPPAAAGRLSAAAVAARPAAERVPNES
jgi:hypothetical protein